MEAASQGARGGGGSGDVVVTTPPGPTQVKESDVFTRFVPRQVEAFGSEEIHVPEGDVALAQGRSRMMAEDAIDDGDDIHEVENHGANVKLKDMKREEDPAYHKVYEGLTTEVAQWFDSLVSDTLFFLFFTVAEVFFP